jgi:hypothetical protein
MTIDCTKAVAKLLDTLVHSRVNESIVARIWASTLSLTSVSSVEPSKGAGQAAKSVRIRILRLAQDATQLPAYLRRDVLVKMCSACSSQSRGLAPPFVWHAGHPAPRGGAREGGPAAIIFRLCSRRMTVLYNGCSVFDQPIAFLAFLRKEVVVFDKSCCGR